MHEFTLATTTFHVVGQDHLLDGVPLVQLTNSVVRLGRDDRQVDVRQQGGSRDRESGPNCGWDAGMWRLRWTVS